MSHQKVTISENGRIAKRVKKIPRLKNNFRQRTPNFSNYQEGFKHFIQNHPMLKDDPDFKAIKEWSLETLGSVIKLFFAKHSFYSAGDTNELPTTVQSDFYTQVLFRHYWCDKYTHTEYVQLLKNHCIHFHSPWFLPSEDPSLIWLHYGYKSILDTLYCKQLKRVNKHLHKARNVLGYKHDDFA